MRLEGAARYSSPTDSLSPVPSKSVHRLCTKRQFTTIFCYTHTWTVVGARKEFAQELLASITTTVVQRAKLPNVFSELYPFVRTYVTDRCFGSTVDVESEKVRSYLAGLDLQEGIANYIARKVGELTVEKRSIEFEKADFKLSGTKAFGWRRNPPPLEAKRTIFNYVATFNDFERNFAEFLDKAPDVLRFASLGTTEQGESGTEFRIDYLKPSGAIGFYHPDWVVVRKAAKGEVNWIIETKGRVWEGTEAKDEAITDWCARITEQTNQQWKFARVNQAEFEMLKPRTLAGLVELRPKNATLV